MKWYIGRVKKLNFWDLAVLKWSSILFGLAVGAYYPDVVRQNIALVVVLFFALVSWLVHKLFKK